MWLGFGLRSRSRKWSRKKGARNRMRVSATSFARQALIRCLLGGRQDTENKKKRFASAMDKRESALGPSKPAAFLSVSWTWTTIGAVRILPHSLGVLSTGSFPLHHLRLRMPWKLFSSKPLWRVIPIYHSAGREFHTYFRGDTPRICPKLGSSSSADFQFWYTILDIRFLI